MKSLLKVGYIARAHGLDGEVVVKTFDPASTVFDDVERLVARARSGQDTEYEISDVQQAPGGDLRLFLRGISNRTAADALRGSTVFVYRADVPSPAEGEYFFGDLEGLRALSPQGQELGVVEGVWSTGPVPNLVIRSQSGEEMLVPFAEDFVSRVDVVGGTIEVKPLTFED